MILLYAVLLAVFVPVNTYWGQNIAGILSTLAASLMIGYRFARAATSSSNFRLNQLIISRLRSLP
jgi:hypothetical protein